MGARRPNVLVWEALSMLSKATCIAPPVVRRSSRVDWSRGRLLRSLSSNVRRSIVRDTASRIAIRQYLEAHHASSVEVNVTRRDGCRCRCVAVDLMGQLTCAAAL